ncbi:hypothetical protein M0R45_026121 [Rubus argutus]|uniref:Uncharacterized protein n=1 Tax=Rubus argutus TaxID=59490 RepID=A0AAW1WWM7_RUBAR
MNRDHESISMEHFLFQVKSPGGNNDVGGSGVFRQRTSYWNRWVALSLAFLDPLIGEYVVSPTPQVSMDFRVEVVGCSHCDLSRFFGWGIRGLSHTPSLFDWVLVVFVVMMTTMGRWSGRPGKMASQAASHSNLGQRSAN